MQVEIFNDTARIYWLARERQEAGPRWKRTRQGIEDTSAETPQHKSQAAQSRCSQTKVFFRANNSVRHDIVRTDDGWR